MDHLPIPPNCQNFIEVHGRLYFRVSTARDGSNNAMILVKDADSDSRNVIASVAEVAWRIEEERLDIALRGTPMPPYPAAWESIPEWSARNEARKNAVAWRTWGSKK